MSDSNDPNQAASQHQSASFTPAPPSRSATRGSLPPEQSRWSSSTLSSVAPTFSRIPTRTAHRSLPPPSRQNTYEYDPQFSQRPRTIVEERPTRRYADASATDAVQSPQSAGPSRTPSSASITPSVARSLSASSREIPIMLAIDEEEVPPVPPLPRYQDIPIDIRPFSTTSSSYQGTRPNSTASSVPTSPFSIPSFPAAPDAPPVPPLPPQESFIRTTELVAPSRTLTGPASAPLVPSSRQRLHSKFYASGDKARSAATSLANTPAGGSPAIGPPSDVAPGFDAHQSTQDASLKTFFHSRSQSASSRPSTAKSKASSILERMSTLKPSRIRDPSKYQRLSEERDPEIPMARMREARRPSEPAEADLGDMPIDISNFEGPATLRTKSHHSPLHIRQSSATSDRDGADILESKGTLTGGIGEGLRDVVETPITVPVTPNYKPSIAKRSGSRWMRRQPSAPHPVTQAGQEAAARSGHVVAVEGGVTVDLTGLAGHTGGMVDPSTDLNLIAKEASKQSYYFPPDPQMPNWRPLPMQPWYLILLISIALTLSAVLEHLFQVANGRTSEFGYPYLVRFKTASSISDGTWFVWKYLGEIILVSYGVMFQATDFEVRRLEPYYQMSRPTGATAEQSLNMDYLTFWSYLIPFKAFRHRQWAVVCSSLCTILASAVLPVLYNAAINLNPNRNQRNAETYKYVNLDPGWTRVMEAVLYLIAVICALLLWQQRRKSGLTGDLKGVAGIASMATKSHILNDFKGLDLVSHRDIHKQLRHRRYILHKGSLWQGEYITQQEAELSNPPKSRNPHPVALHLPIGLALMLCLILFAVLMPIFEFNTKANIVTDSAPWFLPLLSILIKLWWTNLETGVRMIEPFYQLSKRHAAPKVLLLDYNGTIPGVMPIKAALNQHFILAGVGIGSLLMEVLTVCVSSFNVDGTALVSGGSGAQGAGETRTSYLASFVIAELIPGFLICVAISVYLRRRHAFLPRQPGTVASTLAFVHQSRMLYDFVAEDDDDDPARSPTDSLKRATRFKPLAKAKTFASAMSTGRLGSARDEDIQGVERTVRVLESKGKTYGLGWYRGRDGQDHLGIDEEELLHGYQHGVDWSKSHMGGDLPGRWQDY